MALILTWLRLSTLRQLDWYRNSSYQSKDIAHVQKQIAQKMADKVGALRCRAVSGQRSIPSGVPHCVVCFLLLPRHGVLPTHCAGSSQGSVWRACREAVAMGMPFAWASCTSCGSMAFVKAIGR